MSAFDVIIVGGGHAGTEAAAAAARRGARVALLTFDPSKIGAMSCNPAIGGVGKGHIVREVDALDGLMGRATDAAGIHYRMLNRSKGVAVHGPRVQADRRRYAAAIQAAVATMPSITVVAGEAAALSVAGDCVVGVEVADGASLSAPATVLATGTFLGGRLFRGDERYAGGRIEERAATRLGSQLRALALPIARMKTGTPPRLDGRTIDWAALEPQPSDSDAWTMSPLSNVRPLPQLHCAITRTSGATHAIIRDGFARSPLFGGDIEGGGPRYCPSIEDKVRRFGDRDGHQIFLEPEGLDDPLVYPNGISTSLPTDVQATMIASIAGLQRARIVVPGYAVEYDHVDPRILDRTLAVRGLTGLYCAGQINGTTGYEEAAGQGLVAGANAAAAALGMAPLRLTPAQSYIGVMIDDLTLQGVTEPYRMLTARAEFRLALRADNAETRLGALGTALGLIGEYRAAHLARRREQRVALDAAFAVPLSTDAVASSGALIARDGIRKPARNWLRADGVDVRTLVDVPAGVSPEMLAEYVEDARYAPYLERQAAEAASRRANDNIPLADVAYDRIPGLSSEMIERLTSSRPPTLGDAARIRGISPAALTAILLHVKRRAA